MSTNKPAETLTPKYSKLYWCRYGFNGGKQVCLFLGYSESDGAAEANRLGVDVGKL